jgi:hypothetical protein
MKAWRVIEPPAWPTFGLLPAHLPFWRLCVGFGGFLGSWFGALHLSPRTLRLLPSFSFACGECENDHCFFLRKHAGADLQPTRLGSIECWESARFLSPRLQQAKGHLSPSAPLLRDLGNRV